MPTHSGPNIVDNGLIFILDPAQLNSVVENPVTNLVPTGQRACSSNFSRRSSHRETWSYSLRSNEFNRNHSTRIEINPSGNNAQPYADWGFYAYKSGGSKVGDVYTVSFDYKVTHNTTTPRLSTAYANGYKSPTSAGAASLGTQKYELLDDGWTRYSRTATITTAGNTWWRFHMDSNNVFTRVYVDNFQIEVGSDATPFVDGTRSISLRNLKNRSRIASLVNGANRSNSKKGAIIMDGTNDYVGLVNNPQSGLTSASYEFVVKANNLPSDSYYQIYIQEQCTWIALRNHNGSTYFGIDLHNGTGWFDNSGGSNTGATTISTLQANQIYHLVFTWNGNTVKVFLNGELESTTSTLQATNGRQNVTQLGPGRTPRRIGARTDNYWSGEIYKSTFYNRALTPQEVQQNYNSQKSRFGL